MAKQTFTTGQVLTAAQVNSLQTNDFNQTVSVKTAAYVLAAADKGTRIEFNTSGSVTCTVNTGLFDAGDTVIIQNRGAGDVTVTAGTATVNTAGSLVLSQYQSGTLYFISASASIFFAAAVGDLTAVTSGTGISISNAGGPVPTITNSMATEISAKGDLIVGTGSGTFDNLTVGANGTTLVADSATATGLKWAAGASSGLTLISRVDFSNVATQDFDNVFTSTYRTYMVVVEKIFAATATDDGHLQLRSAGPTTKTSGYYQQSFKWTSSAASTSSGGGSEIGFADDMGTTTDYVSGIFWINGVGNTNEQCNVRMQFSNPYGSYLYEGTAMATSGTFTGFRLKSSSSNITGRVAIYGMAV